MKIEADKIKFLDEHLDLLPNAKAELARWLCTLGLEEGAKIPIKLRHLLHGEIVLTNDDRELENATQTLILELLKDHKKDIANRRRVGANRHKPARPIGI